MKDLSGDVQDVLKEAGVPSDYFDEFSFLAIGSSLSFFPLILLGKTMDSFPLIYNQWTIESFPIISNQGLVMSSPSINQTGEILLIVGFFALAITAVALAPETCGASLLLLGV